MATEESSAALRRRRGVIQGSCTRIKAFVDAINQVNPSLSAQLIERRSKLDQHWSDYDDIQTRLESIDETEENHRYAFEEAFYTLTGKIRELLQPASTSSVPRPVSRSSSTSVVTDTPESLAHVRLPKLNLPLFSGKYDEWYPFFDTFNSIIHSNTSLTDIQRLQYLRASLAGDASNVISTLEISAINYAVAWKLLQERYDNKRVIVQNHIKAIMNLPTMTRESVGELRQIADGATRHINALQALKRPTSHWDDLLVHILSNKLDALAMREWQSSMTTSELPTLKQFIEFITRRCQMLEATTKVNVSNAKGHNLRVQVSTRSQASCVATVKAKCNFCRGEHSVYYCKEFLTLTIPQRIIEIRKRKICSNCLRSTAHSTIKCPAGNCKVCGLKHNTLLHATTIVQESRNADEKSQGEPRATSPSAVIVTTSATSHGNKSVILSTAVVLVCDNQGSYRSCRALLDCGSQANFITKRLLDSLGIKSKAVNISISGINNATATATQMAQVQLRSRTNSFTAAIDCIVTERITDKIPAFSSRRNDFRLPRNIQLADPQFHISSDIDILIGAELFWRLLCVGQIRASSEHPILQKTRLGWILAGRLGQLSFPKQSVLALHASVTNCQLHEQLSRFWQIEEINNVNNFTIEERQCEQYFLDNVTRTPQGRFVVKLPFKSHPVDVFGDSKDVAMKRLQGLERRFRRDPDLQSLYSQFLEDYSLLGHMKRVNEVDGEEHNSCYLPHHCVYKSLRHASKFRVVFDASAKGSTGTSLNEILMVGPVVQQDLMSILLRFRTHLYVFAADIIKMYRQIHIHPSQTRYQRILWRDNPDSEIMTFEFNTVTYGTSCASFLATRCLKYLAESHKAEYPVGAACVLRDFYVDDLLSGADSFEETKTVRDQTIQLLQLGGFTLSKWASNCARLLENVNDQRGDSVIIQHETASTVLGIQWNQLSDTFHLSCEANQSSLIHISKRTILSEVAKLFDPLGLLGPVIVLAKRILQELWQEHTHWNESVPPDIHNRWLRLKSQLSNINQLQISRCVKSRAKSNFIQMHGFCDASQHAYGACVYIRTQIDHDQYRVELLCSKSRVAPLKAVSLPRLELSAALLLSRLIDKINSSIKLTNVRIFLWSDSTITLNWISSPSRKWSIFVSNRVGEIQQLTDISCWRHISSTDNPADILSRGMEPIDLVSATAWWHGPTFLTRNESQWPISDFDHTERDLPELRVRSLALVAIEHSIVDGLLAKYSNLNKTCRILAYCRRFIKASRPNKYTISVTPAEIISALHVICRAVQRMAFLNEYRALSEGIDINTTSSLLPLAPFIHSDGLIRVGGRLRNSELDFEACHQILLPRNHDLITRIIEYEHTRNGHAGLQTTMAAIRQRFWPLSLRSTVRKVIQNCITCFKVKPIHSEAMMGSLPPGRVTISRPFYHCGVDYAGPLMLRESRRRNARNIKAYVAIFVCFATKAVHIETVSDLTSDAFIGALKRFVSRRGKPAHIYSDNATTFVGAHRQLREFYESIKNEQAQIDIEHFLRHQGTTWNFIPPHAPHFGGLWEAAVKSTKYHLHRIVGNAHLTFEEMQTVLCEIEAILNSRPLMPLSTDPNDLAYISPGHFLVGTPLNSFPCSDLSEVNENRLVRWQRVEQLRQHFWRRWSTEYLNTLQERRKWKMNKGLQLKINQLVLLQQPGLAPLQWPVGRIQQIHTGQDGNVRAATVKTALNSFVRPLTKIAILPIDP